jgi:hypothetical protein
MSTLQQNWRRGQNRLCLEARGYGERWRGQGAGGRGRNGLNNVCTYELKKKNAVSLELSASLTHGTLLLGIAAKPILVTHDSTGACL